VLRYGSFARDEATYGSDIDIAATNLEERQQRQGRYGYGYGEAKLTHPENTSKRGRKRALKGRG
jgi:predicted nucleotidyltransferase